MCGNVGKVRYSIDVASKGLKIKTATGVGRNDKWYEKSRAEYAVK